MKRDAHAKAMAASFSATRDPNAIRCLSATAATKKWGFAGDALTL